MKTRTWVLLVGATLLAGGAWYGSSRGAKAESTTSGIGAPKTALPRMCNPSTQQGCGRGERCAVMCEGSVAVFGCEPDAPGADIGQLCSGTNKCRRGMCLENPGEHPACLPFCESDPDCAADQRCDDAKIKWRCSMDPSGVSPITARVCRPKSLSIPKEMTK